MRPLGVSFILFLFCFLQVTEVPATGPYDAWTLESQSANSLKFEAAGGQRKGQRGSQAAKLAIERFDLQMKQAVAADQSVVIRLPNPDGQFESFRLVPAHDMHPDLQQWFVDQGWPMRTFKGVNLDHPDQTIRLDWGGPGGLHASIDGPAQSWFIDPVSRGDREDYLSYYRQARDSNDQTWSCSARHIPKAAKPGLAETQSAWSESASTGTGGMLRTFRLALAATGEYTQYHGGAVEAQAAMVTTLARVNQIYERDVSIRMTLIANNHLLIYTNPNTDPYTNSDANIMLLQNQANIDALIGSANYDIGHVFSTFGGGVAYVGGSCITSYKAGGVTGRNNPEGDPFDVDLVAHEMGHQWGSEHTFNSELGFCGGLNRSANSAYEPGSGSTIMAYSGICDADNLQLDSDAYFHARSLDQMLEHTVEVTGLSCGTLEAVNANAPSVDAGGDHLIPIGTPFELTALPLSSEETGESFTYTWEQWDLGNPSSLADGDTGQGPLIRSLEPSSSAARSIPSLTDLQANTQTIGVILPTTERDLNFRATIRDNNPSGGRIGEDFITVRSIAAAGPFALTYPNDGGILEGEQNITWNVAGTTGNSINAAEVDILLSADNGLTWPYVLASATPNDGSETVTLPLISTTRARVRVQPVDRIFFDMSEQAFSIGVVESCASPQTMIETGDLLSTLTVTEADLIGDLEVYVLAEHGWVGDISLSLEHAETGTSVLLMDRPGVPASQFGCDKPDIDVSFADDATQTAENQCNNNPPAISGRLLPVEPLSGFLGESMAGNWRLTVNDALVDFTGTLQQWCIKMYRGSDPQVNVNPPALNFGEIDIDAGPSGTLSLEIQSTGLTDLELAQVSITGTDAALFEIITDSGETLLNPGQARTLEIRFDPDSSGAKAAILRINSNDTDEPVIDIDLRGTGIDASDIIFRDSFESG